MKILLSAFACEPDKGSEFAVGWNWAIFLARTGRQVVVLTRSESRPAIERALQHIDMKGCLRFRYFDVPQALRWQARGPLHVHSAIWQWLAAHHAKKLHRAECFDCVHHVTYAGLRAPSFMGRLGIPFIFGPVGGGERAPWRLRLGYSLPGLLHDTLRDVANFLTRFVPFMTATFNSAHRIYVTSTETLRLMPSAVHGKARIELAIGTEQQLTGKQRMPLRRRSPDDPFRVLYAGRFVDYKGMHLGLPAFAQLAQTIPGVRLTMVGKGPLEKRWRKLAGNLGVADRIDWQPWQDRRSMAAMYANHDVLLFPALHDSGGMVVLEAMSHSLPVVCVKLGGPATMVDDRCGYAIDPAGKTAAEVSKEMGRALVELAVEPTRLFFAESARRRCDEFSWPEKVERIYGLVS